MGGWSVSGAGGSGRERGQTSVLLIGVVVTVVAIAIAFLVPFGSVVVDKRESSTAADAAALAAVGAWRDSLRGGGKELGASATNTELHARVGERLGTFLPESASDLAASFASRNGSELTGFWPDIRRGSVTVEVTANDMVPGTSVRAKATSTARLRFTGGLCARGGVLGVVLHDSCETAAPPSPTSSPGPSGGPPSTPTPEPSYVIPDGAEPFAVNAVLTTP